MPIQILPPQLANQIAAGEVVERPASVVKELVENSLDAGATQIQIDIEDGGAGLIRVRDNGIGIAKTELPLALARHATSKITCIEDLEAILSLGFRGEALASISSVSRLTLTSRPQEQKEAWQVYAQGREMETTIQPASHPVGTTVEVANLFFNTPARRKFLRTAKTEFAHIEEVIRRIALAKFNITFTLTHNGKIIKQYKSAVNNQQKMKRLAAICGENFVHHALEINWKHNKLHLFGWVGLPTYSRNQNDLNYCYVNGRMIRDKVINHAIRQAYAERLSANQYPAFVLFIDLDPNEVDVNVHPTKHEVRFHQSRLVHDFIFQGIFDALNNEKVDLSFPSESKENATLVQVCEPDGQWISSNKPNRAAAGKNIFTQSNRQYPISQPVHKEFMPNSVKSADNANLEAQKVYGELLTKQHNRENTSTLSQSNKNMLRALSLIENKALLLQQDQQFYLISLTALQKLRCKLKLQQSPVSQQALLIPITFRLNASQFLQWQQQKHFFQQTGFYFNENLPQQRISIIKVPACLRHRNIQNAIIRLLEQNLTEFSTFLTALCDVLQTTEINIFADAIALLTETEQLITTDYQLKQLLLPIDWKIYLEKLSC